MKSKAVPEFLRELIMAPGPAGFETLAAECWRKHLEAAGIPCDTDTYGNSYASVGGSAFDVMLVAHIDTVGLMARYVDDSALICVDEIGGLDPQALVGQHVVVLSDPPLHGVIGRRPTHLEDEDEKAIRLHDLRVDVGASKRKALKKLVPVGTPIVFQPRLDGLLGNRVSGTGLDDRIGVWCVAETLKRLKEKDLKVRVHGVATFQEETGLHGAHIAAQGIKPRMAVGIDVTFAIDTPDLSTEHHGDVALGKGPVIGIGGSSHPKVVRALLDAAEKADIRIQREATPNSEGCVEVDAIFRNCGGIMSGLVMVPSRYMHTPVEVVQMDDAEAVVELLVAWCQELGK